MMKLYYHDTLDSPIMYLCCTSRAMKQKIDIHIIMKFELLKTCKNMRQVKNIIQTSILKIKR